MNGTDEGCVLRLVGGEQTLSQAAERDAEEDEDSGEREEADDAVLDQRGEIHIVDGEDLGNVEVRDVAEVMDIIEVDLLELHVPTPRMGWKAKTLRASPQ